MNPTNSHALHCVSFCRVSVFYILIYHFIIHIECMLFVVWENNIQKRNKKRTNKKTQQQLNKTTHNKKNIKQTTKNTQKHYKIQLKQKMSTYKKSTVYLNIGHRTVVGGECAVSAFLSSKRSSISNHFLSKHDEIEEL